MSAEPEKSGFFTKRMPENICNDLLTELFNPVDFLCYGMINLCLKISISRLSYEIYHEFPQNRSGTGDEK